MFENNGVENMQRMDKLFADPVTNG